MKDGGRCRHLPQPRPCRKCRCCLNVNERVSGCNDQLGFNPKQWRIRCSPPKFLRITMSLKGRAGRDAKSIRISAPGTTAVLSVLSRAQLWRAMPAAKVGGD